jgi:hypothetical protein
MPFFVILTLNEVKGKDLISVEILRPALNLISQSF